MPALEGHTSTLVGDYLVVYGGKPSPMSLNGDVFALNLTTNAWNRLLVSGEAPIPRAYHSACRHGRNVIVFGGLVSIGVDDIHHNTYNMFANVDALPGPVLAKQGQERFKDPMEVRYVTQQRLESRYTHCLSLDGVCSWSPVITHGVTPPTRAHHAACVYRETMFIYGGYSCHVSGRLSDEEFKALNVVFGLDLNSKMWTAYDTTESPPRLFGMTSAVFSGNWILQGGIDIAHRAETNETWFFNLEQGRWRQVPQGVVPPMAFSSSAVFGDTLYLVGGSSDRSTRFYPHMYCLDLIKGFWWHKLLPHDEGPAPHCKASLTVCGNKLLLVGGLHTNFGRCESVYAFSPIEGYWEGVNCRYDGDFLDNVRGLSNGSSRGPPPFALGSSVSKLKVSQGAQTGSDQLWPSSPAAAHHGISMSPKLASSPLGESRSQRSTGDVWSSMQDNDTLFGIAQSLERRRADLHGHQRTLEHHQASAAQRYLSVGGESGSSSSRAVSGRAAAIQDEVSMRLSRLSDLVGTSGQPDSQASVHQYWQTELAQLGQEHQRWREAALVDKDLIRSAVTLMEEDAMPRPTTFHHTSPQKHLADSVRMQPFIKGGYVSPSIQRLGLTDELERRRATKQ